MLAPLRTLACSVSELVFLNGPWPGAVLLALLVAEPGLALGAATAWLGAIGGTRLIGGSLPLAGVLALNPLLAGLAVGHLVEPGLGCAIAAMLLGAITATVGLACQHLLRTWLDLPLLSLPFVLVVPAFWLAIARYPALLPARAGSCLLPWAHPGLPAPLDGFLSALGSLLFLPHALAGAVVIALIAVRSRILVVCALAGYATGAGLRWLGSGSPAMAWASPDGFNAMLAAMAIGGVFLVPSWRSLALGLVAAVLCTLAGDALASWTAWGGAGLPALTLPFLVATLLLLFALAVVRSPLLALHPGASPEETLARHWSALRRFPGTLRTLAPPFAGSWTVWQSADGPWTHRGPWRHALDVVVCDAHGATHTGDGSRLEDYHAYQQPILAPVSGQVAVVVDGLPDNPPGGVDAAHPWGNLVIIHDPRGFWVELSHLANGSVRVAPGAWVERGQEVGRCGNSGHSPQPHLHLQVQASAVVGAASLPFSLVGWWDGERCQSNALPQVGGSIAALPNAPALHASARLRLDDQHVFQVRRQGELVGEARWRVTMGDDGGWMLVSPRGRLHVGQHDGTFYVYRIDGHDPWLRLLFQALPRLPLYQRDPVIWDDHLPVMAVDAGWRGQVAALLGWFHPGTAVLRATYRMGADLQVHGEITGNLLVARRRTHVVCDPTAGIVAISVGAWSLHRQSPPVDHGHA